MSNSNTRRRKAKKRARGKALPWPFTGTSYSVRGPGKSRLPALARVVSVSLPPSAGLWDKAWFDELEEKKDPCPSCSCDRNLKGCFCFEESTPLKNWRPLPGAQRALMEAAVEPMDILYSGVTGKPLLKKKALP